MLTAAGDRSRWKAQGPSEAGPEGRGETWRAIARKGVQGAPGGGVIAVMRLADSNALRERNAAATGQTGR